MIRNRREIAKQLLHWFNKNKRPLPWRIKRDWYNVWISEVMLQQTQVKQVLPYYHRFLKKFPNVSKLAQASDQEVLKIWEGLGFEHAATIGLTFAAIGYFFAFFIGIRKRSQNNLSSLNILFRFHYLSFHLKFCKARVALTRMETELGSRLTSQVVQS